jgi:hypothetical protein
MPWYRIQSNGPLPLMVADLAPNRWCHPACYERWRVLPVEHQGILGGHIHFDDAKQSWSVPFAVPCQPWGVLSASGEATPNA